jgi:hypothetical protein
MEHYGVRCDKRADVLKRLAADLASEHGALIIGHPHAMPAELAFSTRFSSRRKSITSRCSRSSQPPSAAKINCSGITTRIYLSGAA